MAITRTHWIDDDGSGTTGTVINDAEKQLLYDQIDAADNLKADRPNTAAYSTGGTTTALPIPSGSGNLLIFLNPATPLTIQGITPGISGQLLTLDNYGPTQIDLSPADAAAPATSRLQNWATSGKTSLATNPATGIGGKAIYQYHSGVGWKLIAHEQGAWITPAYSAANFTGSASMTWTVDAGDLSHWRYRLSGRTVTLSFRLDSTTVGGTLANMLAINNGAWGGFSAVGATSTRLALLAEAGTITDGYTVAIGTVIQIFKLAAAPANFLASTNATSVYGQITFDVS